jgi:hypothetical protein
VKLYLILLIIKGFINPLFITINKKMENDTTNLKVFVQDFKNKFKNPVSVFIIKFEYDKFINNVRTPSNFFKKLSNSKMSISGLGNNRNWWKSIKPNGLYRYKISNNEIEIKFFLESDKPIKLNEIKFRIYKILKPIEMEFHLNDVDYYINSLGDIIEEVKEGMEMFGGVKKVDLDNLKNINELITLDNNIIKSKQDLLK